MMMMINVLIDFVIGLVPFIGDIVDAVYKCNTRNAVILEKHLREKGAKSVKKQSTQPSTQGRVREIQEDTVDHSLPDEWDKQETGVVNNSPPEYREHRASGGRHGDSAGAQQQPRSNRGFSRWFGGASHPEEDLERGR
jgi:bacillopeptidase F (M6 metalloprotease family)